MVIEINDYQKDRFVERVIKSMFNTVSKKKIAVSCSWRQRPALWLVIMIELSVCLLPSCTQPQGMLLGHLCGRHPVYTFALSLTHTHTPLLLRPHLWCRCWALPSRRTPATPVRRQPLMSAEACWQTVQTCTSTTPRWVGGGAWRVLLLCWHLLYSCHTMCVWLSTCLAPREHRPCNMPRTTSAGQAGWLTHTISLPWLVVSWCCLSCQVEPQHVHYELSAAKFSWDHPRVYSSASRLTSVTVVKDPYEACADAHAICVLTGVLSKLLCSA